MSEYRAIIKGTSLNEGRITINVEFTDDENSAIETCIPQDENAFKNWVKERLSFYEMSKKLASELIEGQQIIVE